MLFKISDKILFSSVWRLFIRRVKFFRVLYNHLFHSTRIRVFWIFFFLFLHQKDKRIIRQNQIKYSLLSCSTSAQCDSPSPVVILVSVARIVAAAYLQAVSLEWKSNFRLTLCLILLNRVSWQRNGRKMVIGRSWTAFVGNGNR